MRCASIFIPLVAATAFAGPPPSYRGLSTAAAGSVIWTSGTQGTVLHSTDSGHSWTPCAQPPDAAELDFRGVHAWDGQRALVMSAGAGSVSRIYRTDDGCRSWQLLFSNPDPDGFWDAVNFNFAVSGHGVLLGDPVAGRFTIFRTVDDGRHWTRDSSASLAASAHGEGAFAASNSSITSLAGTEDLLFGTGGIGGFRIFRFDSRANQWTAFSLPVATKNESSGIFSIACRDVNVCVAVGGDYKHPDQREATAFITKNGGRTWAATPSMPGGYRSAVSWDTKTSAWVVAGPGGIDMSSDNGASWVTLDHTGGWNVLSLPWAAGSRGRVERLPTRQP